MPSSTTAILPMFQAASVFMRQLLARRERDPRDAHRQSGASHVHAAEMLAGAGDSENARSHLAALDEFPEWTARRAGIAAAMQARP